MIKYCIKDESLKELPEFIVQLQLKKWNHPDSVKAIPVVQNTLLMK
ncbi:hypothetical protein GO684_03385 [Wolbachia endosymbiont of Litomosoides brasiliensis]|nr:hypothetical protein [Wolbachia endosymbiont of Litomosoides brasiliensis]NUY39693.1 hypothetical protein [Wolbachia endosymbiont of Litomosoides brasiliensis]